MSRPLLAKTPCQEAPAAHETFLGHAAEVVRSMDAVLDCLPPDCANGEGLDFRGFRPLLECMARVHDIGKANSAFQKVVSRKGARVQPLRHEIVGALILTSEDLLGSFWKEVLGERDQWLIAFAIAGHHLKMPEAWCPSLIRLEGAETQIHFHLADDDFRQLLRAALRALDSGKAVPDISDLAFESVEDVGNSIEPQVRRFLRQCRTQSKSVLSDRAAAERLAVSKALLIAADVAGSAVAARGEDVSTYVRDALGRTISAGNIEPIVETRLQGGQPRPFQEEVSQSELPVTLVAAGCGNGKTLAAYMWAARRAIGRKLFFCYPTTGTASAGFADYLLAQSDLERALIHGRAKVDLESMTGADEADPLDDSLRIEALNAWSQKVVVCTVDTVLGLMQNQRRGLYSFPALSNGAFVFDEIHCYDTHLFGALLRFLETFRHLPVLLMTASLSPTRLAALRKLLGDRLGPLIHGDEALERIPRYRIEILGRCEDAWSSVEGVLGENGKVLWVANTIAGAVSIYRHAVTQGHPSVVYHSRFRYRDRVHRQKEVLTRFTCGGEPAFVVATQVCEVSLDISADLLVSAMAPLPALIQRMGRLNRRVTPERVGQPGIALLYPHRGLPYRAADLARAHQAIGSLAGRATGQIDLARLLDEYREEPDFPTASAWLDGGWQTQQQPLRDASYTFTVLRSEDLQELPKRPSTRDVLPLTLSMPLFGAPEAVWERTVKGYPVSPEGTISYSVEEGARWVR